MLVLKRRAHSKLVDLIAVAVLSGCGVSADSPHLSAITGGYAVVTRSLLGTHAARPTRAPPPPRHLYITASIEGRVYSFPATNGLPSRTPDAVITGLVSPFGVAVDSEGYLYVGNEGKYSIDVFAPGATGNATPVRRILFPPGKGPFIIVVRGDYLLTWPGDCCISVFSRFANGNAQPLARIPTYGEPIGMTFDAGGNFYVTELGRKVYVYWDLLLRVTLAGEILPNQVFYPAQPGISYDYGIATSDHEVFVRQSRGGRYIEIIVVPSTANGPTNPLRYLHTSPCGPRYSGIMYSLATYGDYLYEACETPIGVFIYDKNGRGLVEPLYSLRGPFQGADQMALGP